MSLLSTELLSVFLSPTQVLAVRRRGMSRHIVDKRAQAVAIRTGDGWAAVVDAFAAVLREVRRERVQVILSSHFAHYQLVPWRDDLQDSEEELAVVRLAYGETFGEAAARWSIRLSDESPGRPRIAAALDSGLLDAIRQTAGAAKVRLISMQPYLSAAVNHWRDLFDRSHSRWLVLHEENRVCLALLDQARWRWVRCVRAGADWCERLPDMVEHEIMLAGSGDVSGEVLVFAPQQPTLSLRTGTRLPFRMLRLASLRGYSPSEDGPYGLALIG